MNLPNKLTLTRILLVPVFMIFVSLGQYITPSYNPRYYLIAGLIFAVASFTDFLDLAAVALGQTAGDDDLQVGIRLLVGAGLKDVLDGLGLGALDESAGVDEDDVRICEVSHRLVARRQQDVDHHVQIDLILRAAKGNTRNFHMG